MVAAMDGFMAHVLEKVVHPTHVPFETKSQATQVSRTRDAGPGCRFFRDGHDSRETLVANGVEMFHEFDGVEILAPAMNIGHPFARFPGVIKVEHRSNGIHSQAIDMVFVEPEKSVGDQEVSYFVATEIENQRSPIAVFPLPRISVFVKACSVEFSQSEGVLGEVPGHPVQDDSDSFLVTTVDEMTKLIRI